MTASAAHIPTQPLLPPLRDYIDGTWAEPTVDLGCDLEDPNTGEPVQRQRASADEMVDRAITAAARVHDSGEWATLAIEERAGWLDRMADALDPWQDRCADLESATTGAVRRQTKMLAFILPAAFRLAAQVIRDGALQRTFPGPAGHDVEVARLPWGPAVCLVPWNAPAPMAAHKVASALAAGAPTILKPSEFAPHGCGLIAEAAELVGLPAGVFQMVHGGPHVGGRLVTDPRTRSVSFTGGIGAGRAIAAACAADFKPTQLELGGNNPVVLLDDVDVDDGADGVVALLTTLNGQWCRALGRLLLPENRADEILAAVLDRLAGLTAGHSLSMDTDLGPMVHSGHLALLRDRVDELVALGGKSLSSTPLPDLDGNFLAPTLVTGVDPSHTQHEIFGPVGVVHTYRSDDEAVELANGTPYGLEAYVFAADADRGMSVGRRIKAGGVKVNGSSVMSLHLYAPRPAWGLSGHGVEGTVETVQFFTNERVVGIES